VRDRAVARALFVHLSNSGVMTTRQRNPVRDQTVSSRTLCSQASGAQTPVDQSTQGGPRPRHARDRPDSRKPSEDTAPTRGELLEEPKPQDEVIVLDAQAGHSGSNYARRRVETRGGESLFNGSTCARSRTASASVAAAGQPCLRLRLCCPSERRRETDPPDAALPSLHRDRRRRLDRPGVCVEVPLLLQRVVNERHRGLERRRRNRCVDDL
jgi:hypothetical protein